MWSIGRRRRGRCQPGTRVTVSRPTIVSLPFTLLRSVPVRFARVKFASVRFVSFRYASVRSASVRSASVRSARFRFAPNFPAVQDPTTGLGSRHYERSGTPVRREIYQRDSWHCRWCETPVISKKTIKRMNLVFPMVFSRGAKQATAPNCSSYQRIAQSRRSRPGSSE